VITTAKLVGWLAFVATSIAMFVIELRWLLDWWGGLGAAAGVVLVPLLYAFPVPLVLTEGWADSAPFLVLWAIAGAALGLVGLATALEDDD
jgi:hypothetical protein